MKFNPKQSLPNIRLDNIYPENVTTYEINSMKEKTMLKDVRGILGNYGKESRVGFVLCEKDDGDFLCLFTASMGKYIYKYQFTHNNYSRSSNGANGMEYSISDVMSQFKMSNLNMLGIKYIHVYDVTGIENKWIIQNNRLDAKKGMIYMDEASMKQMLREQRERYKKEVARLKASKSNMANTIANEFEKLMQRFTKYAMKCMTNTSFADSQTYKSIFEKIGMAESRRDWNGKYSLQNTSLIALIKNYSEDLARVATSRSTYHGSLVNQETNINNLIGKIDDMLKLAGF